MKTCEVVVGKFASKLEAVGLQGWVRYKANELRDTPSVTWLCCFWDLCWNFRLALHCTGWELWGEGGNVRGHCHAHWLRFLSLLLWDFGTMGSASLQLWLYQQWGEHQEGARAEVSCRVVCWDCAASKTVWPSQDTVASPCLAKFCCGYTKVKRLLSEHLFPPGLSFWQVTVHTTQGGSLRSPHINIICHGCTVRTQRHTWNKLWHVTFTLKCSAY